MAETISGPQLYGDPNELGAGQYQPLGSDQLSESVRLAVFGFNPKTGRAFTEAESAAANAGYVPEVYRGIRGYDFNPETGRLTVLNTAGTAAGLGATFKQSPTGNIVPDLPDDWTAFRYDDQGRPVNAQGEFITEADIRQYNDLVGRDPEAAREFAQGKGISGRAVASGSIISTTPRGAGSPNANVTFGATTADGKPLPGTAAFTGFQERESAYNLLYEQMAAYGLQALVEPLRNLVLEGVSPSEFTIRLRDTDAYKKRFAANQSRIQRGLRALSEAEYIGLEDQYQSIMRNYGLPASYYQRGDMGRQEGFEKFIAGDVSAAELEDRIQTAQNRVINAAPEVARTLRDFYPGITNGDILAYTLDPDKALTEIRRKVTAAEIGAGAAQAGLPTSVTRAEELGRYGVTADQARAGFQQVAQILPRGSQLSEFYRRQGVGPYTQTTAEQEVFGIPGAVEAQRQRRKLTELETAAFSGQAGITSGALARDRAGAF